jgi:hypothetical protein
MSNKATKENKEHLIITVDLKQAPVEVLKNYILLDQIDVRTWQVQ